MTGAGLALTDEQCSIVAAQVDARLVVLAPAGTGKTEVVSQRLTRLVVRDGLLPGSDLLVLSFSRNAVAEVKRRLRAGDPRVTAAQVATFDSYASRLLVAHQESGDWEGTGYDDHIRSALALIVGNKDVRADMRRYRHVVVDEIQDLVGDRGELVAAILDALATDAGFTLLGDPAQGIYDFQLDQSLSPLTGRQFLRHVFDGTPKPELRVLSANFRARSPTALAAAASGDALRNQAIDDLAVPGEAPVIDALFRLHTYSAKLAAGILSRTAADGQSAAVLCRDNGRALAVSRSLWNAGVAHVIQPSAGDQPVARWLAAVVRGYSFPTMSPSEFMARIDGVTGAPPDADLAWRGLKRTEGRRQPDLSLRVLASRLRTRRVPDELVEPSRSQIVVSSVHRAKGLEWDVVFLCGLNAPGTDLFEDARLAYVAMTRARDELYGLEDPDRRGLHINGRNPGRWVRTDFTARRAGQIELLEDDFESNEPGGAHLLHESPEAIQDYLGGHVKEGDPVDLTLFRSYLKGEPRAIYRVDHNGTAIGVTTKQLSDAVMENSRRTGGNLKFPEQMLGGRILSIATNAGSSAAGIRAGLGASGLWLRPIVGGLADVYWEIGR